MTTSSPDLAPTPAPESAEAALCPGVRDFVRITNEAYVTHQQDHGTTPPEKRLVAEKVRAPWVKGGPVMHTVTEHRIAWEKGEVRIRVYDPDGADQARPGLIYVHGGGWVMFSLDTHDRIMREYAGRAGVRVIGVDYSLSPEARFPLALEEIVAVIRHVRDNARAFGVDPKLLAVGGDSAGANLSLSAAISLRDAGEADAIRALLFNYGAFDTELARDDVRKFGGPDYMLTAPEMDFFWTQYLTGPADRVNPLAVPLRADLHALPPAFVCVPQCDVLTTQSLHLAQGLRAAGNQVELVVYPGATHSFLEAVSISPIAQQAFSDAARWLRAELV